MHTLFDHIQPYQTHQLKVDETHCLYIEESGNPNGIPAVFIHGGPGGGCDVNSRRFFDPKLYHIITYDQRGCGRSTPHASLENNTTWHLVADLEKIRQLLKITNWLVFGGSWGSTLALAYAQSYPQAVLALVLRGIYLCRPREIIWYYQDGASHIYPDAWQDYLQHIPPAERTNLVSAYYRRLTSPDRQTQLAAAAQWYLWEMRTSYLLPKEFSITSEEEKRHALAFARIECHYFINNAFLTDNQLLNEATKIVNIPCVIVHGRYDMPCPFENAYLLHQALPKSELHLIPNAGHAAFEPDITAALIAATNKFGQLFGS